MRQHQFFIFRRRLLSLLTLILLITLGANTAKAGGTYGGTSYDYFHQLEVGDSVTLNTIRHANQTGFYWSGWRGYETGGRLQAKSGTYWWTHDTNRRGMPLISATHDIDGVAYFEMGGSSATVTATRPGIVVVDYTVTYWTTHYDPVLGINVVSEQDAEQRTRAIIVVRATPCTLTFNANGGSGSSYTQSATKNESIILSPNRFTRNGYAFAGWNTTANGTGTSYANEASIQPGGNLTLYAQWRSVPPALTDVTRTDDNISVTANCPDSEAMLFCGVYNNSGQMVAVRSVQITGESNYQFQFDGQQFDYAKAFLLDSDFRPLCESRSS